MRHPKNARPPALFAAATLTHLQNVYDEKYYRTDSIVGRIVNRVATFRNIANDLLRALMIKNLIEYF